MTTVQVRKQTRQVSTTVLDLRTPSGRALPY
jgi:hypothetical protein